MSWVGMWVGGWVEGGRRTEVEAFFVLEGKEEDGLFGDRVRR